MKVAVNAIAIVVFFAGLAPDAYSSTSEYAVECNACAGQLNNYYAKNKAKSEDINAALARLNGCFSDLATHNLLVSTQEIRNVFEASGEFFKFDTLYKNKEWLGKEEDFLKAAVSDGYWKGMWPFGATDCETHARNLKAFLEDRFSKQGLSDDFKVEVVNSYPNIKATDASANPLPGSNHYIVRIVSMKTGRSYTGDVYTGVHFSREDDGDRITFNDFEACFFDQVTLKVFGKKMSEGSWSAIASSFTPVLRTKLAQAAKSSAGQCRTGARQASFSY